MNVRVFFFPWPKMRNGYHDQKNRESYTCKSNGNVNEMYMRFVPGECGNHLSKGESAVWIVLCFDTTKLHQIITIISWKLSQSELEFCNKEYLFSLTFGIILTEFEIRIVAIATRNFTRRRKDERNTFIPPSSQPGMNLITDLRRTCVRKPRSDLNRVFCVSIWKRWVSCSFYGSSQDFHLEEGRISDATAMSSFVPILPCEIEKLLREMIENKYRFGWNQRWGSIVLLCVIFFSPSLSYLWILVWKLEMAMEEIDKL